jgi:hypothetical protein
MTCPCTSCGKPLVLVLGYRLPERCWDCENEAKASPAEVRELFRKRERMNMPGGHPTAALPLPQSRASTTRYGARGRLVKPGTPL